MSKKIKQIAVFHETDGWTVYGLSIDPNQIEVTDGSQTVGLNDKLNSLTTALNNKFDKTGGKITGNTTLCAPPTNRTTASLVLYTTVNNTAQQSHINAYAPTTTVVGSNFGNDLVIKGGSSMVLGGGESPDYFYSDKIAGNDPPSEGCHIVADGNITINTKYGNGNPTIRSADLKQWTFDQNGVLTGPGGTLTTPSLTVTSLNVSGGGTASKANYVLGYDSYGLVKSITSSGLFKAVHITKASAGSYTTTPMYGRTWTCGATVALPAGRWYITGNGHFPTMSGDETARNACFTTVKPGKTYTINSTKFYCYGGIGSTAAPTNFSGFEVTPANGSECFLPLNVIQSFSAPTTVYEALRYQGAANSSASTKNGFSKIWAIKLSDA